MNRHQASRLTRPTAAAWLLGLALFNAGSSHAIGGLCNGRPASHSWLDGSGQYGPFVVDGTDLDDVIVGSDGDDVIDAGPGNDTVCGGPGDDVIEGGDGTDVLRGDTGDDDLDGGDGTDTAWGEGGNDTITGGSGPVDSLVGGPGDDVMISNGDGEDADRVLGESGFDICLFGPGDAVVSCEY